MKSKMEFIQEQLARLARLYQLPVPTPEYVKELSNWLHDENWKGVEFKQAIDCLLVDPEYGQKAQYNKYPFSSDFAKVREIINPFEQRIKIHEQERELKALSVSDVIKQIGSK